MRQRILHILVLIAAIATPAWAGGSLPGTVDLGSSALPHIDGPSAGAGFGSGALATGDIDGDGYIDLVIGAPDAMQGRGALYVIRGNAGVLPVSRNLATTPADLTISGAPGSHLGVAAAIADIDGDGSGELIVSTGAFIPAFGRLASGGALIFRGGSTFVDRTTIDLSVEQADACIADPAIATPAGESIVTGDFNYDSFQDVAVGSPASPGLSGQARAGRAFVLLGDYAFPAGEVIDGRTDWRVHQVAGSSVGEELGTTLAVGDVNDDLLDDLVLGMPNSTVIRAVTFEKAGKVAVVSGGDIREPAPVEVTPGAFELVLGSDYGDYLGLGVAVADVTGDGVVDVVASAIDGDGDRNQRYPDCGELFTIASESTTASQRIVDLMEEAPWMRVIGAAPRRFLGGGLAAGDMDGDRRAEIVASSKSAPGPNGSESGVVYVLGGAMTTIDLASVPAESTILGPSTQSALGTVVRMGDMNGDGVADILSSAPGALSRRGSVYIVPGARSTPDTAPTIEPIADILSGPGDSITVAVHAHDADGDPLRLSVTGRPPGSSFVYGRDGTGSLALAMIEPDSAYDVRIQASDGQLSSSTTFHIAYSAAPAPAVTKAVYRNGSLKVTGSGFSSTSTIAVNGQPIALPVSFNARKSRLRVVGPATALGILPGQNANVVVVTTGSRPSLPFLF